MSPSAARRLTVARSKHKPVKTLRGSYEAKGKKFGIVVSRFNEFLTERLLEGALDTLMACGANRSRITVVRVPGAFEMPLAARRLAESMKPHAILTLAVVIRGKTKHFDQVTIQVAQGVRELTQTTGLPVILGMISADSPADAIERVGLKQMNKGREWALSAIEMANLLPVIKSQKGIR